MPGAEVLMKSRVSTPSMVLIPADLASLTVVRAALQEALWEHAWCEEDVQRVVLAASEAAANAVEHGSQPGELVEVVFQVGDEEATVRVLDSGGACRWEPCVPELPELTAPRGRGLTMISALAQKVEFRPAGRGTEVRLDFTRAG